MTQPLQRQPDVLRSAAILARIADTLRLPVAAFASDATEPTEVVTQAAELVDAFLAIDGVAARRTCLAFVRALSRP